MIEIRPASEFRLGKEGIYKGVPDEEYFAFPCVSNSRLSALKKSPAHCKRAMDGDWETTPSMAFGSAAHCALLEPEVYLKNYRVFEGDLRSNAQKEKYAKFVELIGERNVIREKDALDIRLMQDALRKHRAARAVLDLPGIQECAVLWRHEETGLLVKQKIDHLALEAGVVVDYKTTADADPYAFGKSTFNYGYHRQGALYLMGLSALGIKLKDFVIVAQERSTPEAISCMRIVNEALEAGRSEVEFLMRDYKMRMRTEEWPEATKVLKFYEIEGHDKTIVDVDIPKWAYTQIYDQELEVK
jgi:hypothetical protein